MSFQNKRIARWVFAIAGIFTGILFSVLGLAGLISNTVSERLIIMANYLSAFILLPGVLVALCSPKAGGLWLTFSGIIAAILWWLVESGFQRILKAELIFICPVLVFGGYALILAQDAPRINDSDSREEEKKLQIFWLRVSCIGIGLLNLYWGLFATKFLSEVIFFLPIFAAVLSYYAFRLAGIVFLLNAALSLLSLCFIHPGDFHLLCGTIILVMIPSLIIGLAVLRCEKSFLTPFGKTRLI